MTPRMTTYLERDRPVCPHCGYDVDTQGHEIHCQDKEDV